MSAHTRARAVIIATFIFNGVTNGSFAARIPDIKQRFAFSPGELGLYLFLLSIAVLITLAPAGRLVARFGSRNITFTCNLIVALSVFSLGTLHNRYTFALSLIAYGASSAAQDVAMNTHAITLEHESGKKFMSSFHAFFSVGASLGGIIGGLAAQFDISYLHQCLFVGSAIIIATVATRNFYLPTHLDQHEYEEKKRRRRPRIFWLLGGLGLLCAIGEGAAADWGGILARETFGASPFIATLPYIFFTCAMITGRFSGDYLATRYKPADLIFISGLVAGLGLSIGLLLGGVIGTIFAWACLGAGVSLVIPMLFSAGGDIAKRKYAGTIAPSDGVAMVGGIAYFGFTVGPPLIGQIAELVTLRWAMAIPALGCVAMALSARPLIASEER